MTFSLHVEKDVLTSCYEVITFSKEVTLSRVNESTLCKEVFIHVPCNKVFT